MPAEKFRAARLRESGRRCEYHSREKAEYDRALVVHKLLCNFITTEPMSFFYRTRSMLAIVREPVRHWFTTLPFASTSMIRRPV